MRAAIALALTTSSRGRGKAIVIHPAERMNAIAANAFLKTLEEPAGDARFVLCTAAPDGLLPTIRSRCQAIALELPPTEVAATWLRAQGVAEPEVLLAGCGGQPQDVLALAQLGVDAAAWRAFPGRVAAGDVSALRGWPLPLAVDALQKLCHDAASAAARRPPLRRRQPAAAPPHWVAVALGSRSAPRRRVRRASLERRARPREPGRAGTGSVANAAIGAARGEVDSLHLRR